MYFQDGESRRSKTPLRFSVQRGKRTHRDTALFFPTTNDRRLPKQHLKSCKIWNFFTSHHSGTSIYLDRPQCTWAFNSVPKQKAAENYGMYCSTEKSLECNRRLKNLPAEMRRLSRRGVAGVQPPVSQRWKRARRWAARPAVTAVCRSCRRRPSTSAAAAGGAERLSG